ncbi:MAG: helix-turn-helix domain-containing protein [Candidatus Omnitrophota bacterium]|nr:helix-turn-helix domain-containing protein [Candidatus Omnitrophota bacterium]
MRNGHYMKSENLRLLISEGEGLTVEFKEHYTSRINRDITAFSNTKGGYILLGITDDGRVTGEKLTNKLKAEIIDIARHCEPQISIKRIAQVETIIVIDIEEGMDKPYSCGDGYFRRLDAVTQKMNRREIELLFKQAFKSSFEEQINTEANFSDIDESKINEFFKEANIHVSSIDTQRILSSLNLCDGEHIKNAGVLFFAKKPRRHILQCEMILAAFKGKNRIHIYDREDVQDDLLTQFNRAITFLEKHLNVRSEIQGVNRRDIYEMPIEALREAVANAIIHRDYSMRGTSSMVEVHEDRVEIRNPGGIPEGLTPRSLINLSVRRNELIADLFARMGKVERIGMGIRRMRDLMKKSGLPYPVIKSGTFFRIIFRRPSYSLREESKEGWVEGLVEGLVESQKKILVLVKRDPVISKEELSKSIGISTTAIDKNIRRLKKKGLIKRIGPAKGGHWEVVR